MTAAELIRTAHLAYQLSARRNLAYRRGEIPLERVSASVQGWVNHVRYGNTVGLRKAVLENLSYQLCNQLV